MSRILVIITVALLISCLSGCFENGSANLVEEEMVKEVENSKTVLKVLSTTIIESPEGEIEGLLADEFMALNPDITIEFVSVPMNSASTKIINAAIEGELPDIFVNMPEFIYGFYDLDIATDLNEYLDEPYLEGFGDNLIREATIDGELLFFPWFTTTMAVIYRRDWFESKGLATPETWDEFLSVALEMTEDRDGDGFIDRWGMTMVGTKNSSGSSRFINILRSFGAYELREEDGLWVTDVDTDQGKEALQFFGDLYTKYHVVPLGPIEVSYSEAITQMASEMTAMMITGPHSLGAIYKENPALEGKLGSFVVPKGDHHTSTQGIHGYSISKESPNKEAAISYLKFLALKENQLRWHYVTGRMPSREEAFEEISESEVFAGFTKALDYVEPYPRVIYYAEMPTILGEAYQSVLTETEDVETAATKAATRIRQSIESTK